MDDETPLGIVSATARKTLDRVEGGTAYDGDDDLHKTLSSIIDNLGADLSTEMHARHSELAQTGATYVAAYRRFNEAQASGVAEAGCRAGLLVVRAGCQGNIKTFKMSGDHPIYWPTRANKDRVDRLWLMPSAGSSVKGATGSGRALHVFAQERRKETEEQFAVARIMVQAGAKREARQYAGFTPLVVADRMSGNLTGQVKRRSRAHSKSLEVLGQS